MANDCCGRLKVVAKDKETIDRLYKILQYEDNEYCLSGCRFVEMTITPRLDEDNNLWYAFFDVSGAWNCSRFFDNGDRPTEKLYDREKQYYVNAHYTDLTHLAEKLNFGCELFACEAGNAFCEHCAVDHFGTYNTESDEYRLDFPKDENGEEDFDAKPTEIIGLSNFMEFADCEQIYG
jgi:hypothetical protein